MIQTALRIALSGLAVVGVASASLIGGSAIASVATNAAAHQPQDVVMVDPKAGQQLYAEETATFPYSLPEGASWPGLPPMLLKDDVRMESNVPRALASQYWLCAWEGAYLESSVAGKADDRALDMIVAFESLPYYKEQVIDPEQGWYKGVLTPALTGDLSGVAQDYEGCK